ncbi:retinol dehydrogenase 12-like isoform X1 [Rhodnius prolixus]|uniref:retinol dehydrogenase 12-like isoform X1 n=1 Tax=Rhodnius prolixus TaxID=13249 RepID=UPI003D18B489
MGFNASKVITNKRLDGKTALITGSNTGIGKATAKELYRLGARVILACRDIKRAEDALLQIQNEVRNEDKVGELVIKHLNLSSFSSVRKCAEEINLKEENLHFLINNAGVMVCPEGKTEDGFETHFGVNHLGHFLLTCLLLPKIINSAPARIINVSSDAHKFGVMHWDDLNYEKKRYSAIGAYAQSKLANVLFTMELAEKLKAKSVAVYSIHPGIVRTDLGRYVDKTFFWGAHWITSLVFMPFYKTPDEGALTILHCALKESDEFSGCYFSDCRLQEDKESLDRKYGDAATKLWTLSSDLVNYDFDFKKIEKERIK